MQLHLALHSNVDRAIENASMKDQPEVVRRLNFGLDKGIMTLESWVLSSGGTMVQSGGPDIQFQVPADRLSELLDILRQFSEASGASAAVGVGSEASEAAIALKVARKRGGNPAVVLYTPEIATELEEGDDELAPIGSDEADALESEPVHKSQFGNDDKHPVAGEATRIQQGELTPGAAQPSAPSPQSPPSAAPAPEQEAQGGQQAPGGGLRQQVGEILMDVKKQLPTLEQLKQSNPKAYDSIIAMTQAVIALAQKLFGGEQGQGDAQGAQQPAAAQAPVQKSEKSEFELGVEVESEEHSEMSRDVIEQLVRDHLKEDPHYYSKETLEKVSIPEQKPPAAHHHVVLPVGSVKDQRTKVIHSDGSQGWVQVKAGQILSEDGHSISSRNPGGR